MVWLHACMCVTCVSQMCSHNNLWWRGEPGRRGGNTVLCTAADFGLTNKHVTGYNRWQGLCSDTHFPFDTLHFRLHTVIAILESVQRIWEECAKSNQRGQQQHGIAPKEHRLSTIYCLLTVLLPIHSGVLHAVSSETFMVPTHKSITMKTSRGIKVKKKIIMWYKCNDLACATLQPCTGQQIQYPTFFGGKQDQVLLCLQMCTKIKLASEKNTKMTFSKIIKTNKSL